MINVEGPTLTDQPWRISLFWRIKVTVIENLLCFENSICPCTWPLCTGAAEFVVALSYSASLKRSSLLFLNFSISLNLLFCCKLVAIGSFLWHFDEKSTLLLFFPLNSIFLFSFANRGTILLQLLLLLCIGWDWLVVWSE